MMAIGQPKRKILKLVDRNEVKEGGLSRSHCLNSNSTVTVVVVILLLQ